MSSVMLSCEDVSFVERRLKSLEEQGVDAICNPSTEQKLAKKWFTFCTTNGTFVHDEIQDWLLKNDDTIEVLYI